MTGIPQTVRQIALSLALTGAGLAGALGPAGCTTGAGGGPPPTAQATTPRGSLLPVINTYRLDNGMVIQDLRIGTGEPVSNTDTIRVDTLGTFPDSGEVFYSTVGTGEGSEQKPLTVPVRGLIQGWRIGLPGTEKVPPMRVGGIRTLEIPWRLAYGAEGKRNEANPDQSIPPEADLYFTIELLAVNPGASDNGASDNGDDAEQSDQDQGQGQN